MNRKKNTYTMYTSVQISGQVSHMGKTVVVGQSRYGV